MKTTQMHPAILKAINTPGKTYRDFVNNVAANPQVLLEQWEAVYGEKTAEYVRKYQCAMCLPATYGYSFQKTF